MKLNTLLPMYIWAILSTIWFSSLEAQETLDCEPRTILIKFSKENLQLPTGNIKLTDISSTKIKSLLQSAGFEEGTRIFPNFSPGDTLKTTSTGHRVRLIDLSRYFKIKVGAGTDLNALVDSLRKVPSIDYVDLNWTVHPMQVALTDPLSIKQNGFGPINAFRAWSLNTGGDVKIAIIDGGVDYNHQDLDTGNRTRVLAGWDFGNGDSNPMDDLGGDWANHGTRVAGVVGAITNNTLGVAGVCWQVQIIPVKAVASGADVVFKAYSNPKSFKTGFPLARE